MYPYRGESGGGAGTVSLLDFLRRRNVRATFFSHSLLRNCKSRHAPDNRNASKIGRVLPIICFGVQRLRLLS